MSETATIFTNPRKLLRCALGLAAAVAMAGASAAGSATGASADAQARFQQDRAACMSGQSSQDRATCLKEAGAALAEAKRGNLASGQGELRRNAMDRCNALTGDERTDCIARMRGAGTVSGSVEGGGILREKRTVVPAPASDRTNGNGRLGGAPTTR